MSKPIIVIIEDDGPSRDVLKSWLQNDAKCFAFRSGEEALEATKDLHFDLAVIDLRLPKMTGWDVLKAYQEAGRMEHSVAVTITAYHSDEVEADAIKKGFTACYKKPLDPDDVIPRLLAFARAKSKTS